MVHPVAARAPAYVDDLFPPDPPPQIESGGSDLLEQIERFGGHGARTLTRMEDGIPYLVNEFWTAGQRQAHSLHEISYRACFKPQLPAFFIDRVTRHGEVVHDPFSGRGTTAIQAALSRRVPSANDINPLSTLLTRPRLAPPALADMSSWLAAVDWNRPVVTDDRLLVFYHPETLRQLTVLREHLLAVAPIADAAPDPVADWVRMVALNRLTGHSPGFFSVYTMPPNQAVGLEAQRRINAKRGQVPPLRDVSRLILKKSRSLLADGPPPPAPAARLLTGPADHSPSILDSSVALVVTSPPFLDIVQYADDNWLRCWFAGIDADAVAITMHRTGPAWQSMVRSVLVEMARILRPGGHVAFEVGEVRGGKVLLERLVWAAAEGLPFARLGVMVNQQEFTKTANCWGISNNKAGTNSNRIVLLRRG